MPDGDAHQEHQCRDDPRVLRPEGQRIMVRQHQEDHGQRQVVVMGRSQFRDLAVFRIGFAPRLEIGDHDPLVGHDDDEHIGRHDRCGEGAQMQQGRTPRENLIIPPGHHHQQREKQQHQYRRLFA